jgi:hypothetical protein
VDLPCSERVAALWVEDKDRAKEFWTETVGFDPIRDALYSAGEGAPEQRRIEVAPPDRNVILFLEPPPWGGQPSRAGQLSDVLFTCDDI